MYRILVAEPLDFTPEAVRILEDVGEVHLCGINDDEAEKVFQEYDVCWFRLARKIDRKLLGDNPRCKIIATATTGLDHIDLKACEELGIKVVSLKGETEFLKTVRATAELTVALALALMRRIPQAAQSVKEGVWNRDLFRGNELFGKTSGIIGIGRLGSIVADYFKVFGMNVIGYDPRHDFPNDAAKRVGSLHELLSQSDLISVHVVYNEATKKLLSEKEFTAMKDGAVLINTSRGGVIDEEALLDVLKNGKLSGAALDVLCGEPNIDSTHPLIAYAREHENLLIVPHIGGNTHESFVKTETFIARKVVDALKEQRTTDNGQRTNFHL
jgi:D-3-phosphoglycerate dehydrogenase